MKTKRQDRNTKKPQKSQQKMQQKMRDLTPKKEVRGGYWPQKPDGSL
jgi:hypothetical protein